MHCPHSDFSKKTICEYAEITAYRVFESNEDFEFLLCFLVIQVLVIIGTDIAYGARKNGTPITSTHFKQVLDLTFKYLSDSESLKILLLNYIKSFKSLCEGEIDYEIFKISDEKIFEKVVDHLKVRKRNIELKLIQNDEDSDAERIRMRGEIDGINYALETIKTV